MLQMFTEVSDTFSLRPYRICKASLSGLILIIMCVRK